MLTLFENHFAFLLKIPGIVTINLNPVVDVHWLVSHCLRGNRDASVISNHRKLRSGSTHLIIGISNGLVDIDMIPCPSLAEIEFEQGFRVRDHVALGRQVKNISRSIEIDEEDKCNYYSQENRIQQSWRREKFIWCNRTTSELGCHEKLVFKRCHYSSATEIRKRCDIW